MKVIKWLICLTVLCQMSMAFARDYNACCPCDPCDSCFSNFDYSFYADFLYWKPSRTELIKDTDGSTEYLDPDYDVGYRLGARLHCNKGDLGIRYTSFESDDKSGDAKLGLDYDVVDIEARYALDFDCNKFILRPFMGVKLAWIDEVVDNDDNDKGHQDFEGYGIYLGTEANYLICNNLSLIGRGSFGILYSKFAVSKSDENRHDERLYTPVLDGFIGFNYDFCEVYCTTPSVQIGYEVQHWGWREYSSDSDIANLGLGGLTFRVNLDF
ncbi:MAG: hypothetical protein K940chlam7_01596 [Chlamydiae bacterium]|nr:hypothetical protein [Chlamydiota bacterium]